MWTVGQSLGESLYFYRRHFLALAALLVPLVLPVFLLLEYRISGVLHNDPKLVSQDTVLLLQPLLSLLASAITTLYCVAQLDGQRPSRRALLGRSLRLMPALLLLELLMFFAVLGGAVFFIIPGLWLLACLQPASVYVMVEGLTAPQAMQRSFTVYRPLAWQLLAAMAMTLLGLLPVMILVAGLKEALEHVPVLGQQIAGNALLDVLVLLVFQFWNVVLVRYYDERRQQPATDAEL